MKALFVVNARSGPDRKLDAASIIHRNCHWPGFEVVLCGRKEDLDPIVNDAHTSGFEAIFAVGGDGTVHELAKRLIGRPLALGVIPTGSGNGFARHLGIPLTPAAAVAAHESADAVAIDTAEMNGIPFIAVMGVGFDAAVADRFASYGTRGLRTYLRAGAEVLASLRPEQYQVSVDGRREDLEATMIAVANTSEYGNGARIAPLASARDGALDVVILSGVRLMRAPMLVARMFGGSFHRAAGVQTRRAAEVIIRRQSSGPVHLDGEPEAGPAEIIVRVRPLSLRVLVPDATRRI